MKILVPVLALLLAGCLEPSTTNNEAEMLPADDTRLPLPEKLVWKRLADAPTPRAEHAAAVLDGKIYSIGGYFINNNIDGVALGPGAVVSLASVDVYDIKTDTWSSAPDYPVTLNHEAAAAHNGYVYVFYGGNSYKLNVAKQAWEPIADVPHGSVTAALDPTTGKIYVAGAGGDASLYDPATDAYEPLPEYPRPRSHVASGVVDGKFYIGNGDLNGHAVNAVTLEIYDPVTGAWTTGAPNPVARGSTVGTTWRDRFLVLGGQNQTTGMEHGDMIGFGQPAYADVEAYDPWTDTWTKLPDMPHGRHGFGAVAWDDKVYIVSGAPQEGVSGFAETLVLEAAG